jgi:hypothetical protein
MRRDILLVLCLDAAMLLLTCGHLLSITYLWRGFASVYVTIWWAFAAITCTLIAGALIRRLILAIMGILAFWSVMLALELSTTSASFLAAIRGTAILAVIQIVMASVAWLYGLLLRTDKR